MDKLLPNGKSRITELIDQEQAKNVALLFTDSKGNSNRVLSVSLDRKGIPYWLLGDASEEVIRKNIGDDLYNSIGKTPVTDTNEYKALVQRVKTALEQIESTEEIKQEKKLTKQEEKRKQKQLEEAKKVAEASQQVLPTSTGAVTPVETPIVETPVVEETKVETPTTPSTPTALDPEVAKQVEVIQKQIARRIEKDEMDSADIAAVNKLLADPTPENIQKARQLMRETILIKSSKSQVNASVQKNIHVTPEEAAKVESELQGKTLIQVGDWLSNHGPNKIYRLIATKATSKLRQLQRLGVDMEFKIVQPGEMADSRLQPARGLTIHHYDTPTGRIEVLLKSSKFNDYGTTYEIALHEVIHAAVAGVTRIGLLDKYRNTPIGQAAKDLHDLYHNVTNTYIAKTKRVMNKTASINILDPVEKFAFEGGFNLFEDIHEFVAYGLTNPDVQKYFESIPYKNTNRSTWSIFVDAVRRFLGLKPTANIALSEILQISDELFQVNTREVANFAQQEGIVLAAKTSSKQPTITQPTPKTKKPLEPLS